MMDKSHCFMNPNDEHEYELFYDFAKFYDNVNNNNNSTTANQSEE